MAHQQNQHHLKASTRAKISEKVHAALERDEAHKRALREERKIAREETRELKHLHHEQLEHDKQHGYTAAEKQEMGEESRRTERADATENAARARARLDHELATRTWHPEHRRNRH